MPKPKFGKFGQLLKSLREARRYTQRYIAGATGMNNTYLSRVEKGEAPAPEIFPTVFRIAKALELKTGTDEFKRLIIAAWQERNGEQPNQKKRKQTDTADEERDFEEFEHFLMQMMVMLPKEGLGRTDAYEAVLRIQPFVDQLPPGQDSYFVGSPLQGLQLTLNLLSANKSILAIKMIERDGTAHQIIFPPEDGKQQAEEWVALYNAAARAENEFIEQVYQTIDHFKAGKVPAEAARSEFDSAWAQIQRVSEFGEPGVHALKRSALLLEQSRVQIDGAEPAPQGKGSPKKRMREELPKR